MAVCTVENCSRKLHGKGLCDAHGKLKMRRENPEYSVWQDIKRRCYNENSTQYIDWGGRGIQVCERWRNSYANFLADMGRRPSPEHSIDRVDVNGNYEPSNCRWATRLEQANNKRNNVLITIDGVTDTITGWSQRSGLSRRMLHTRYYKGVPPKDFLNPSRYKTKGYLTYGR